MKFEPGHSKKGGRKPGTQNKKRVLRVEEVLLAAGLNPVTKLLEILPFLGPKDAARVLLELQAYVEPKPKAPDVVPMQGETLELVAGNDADLLEALDANVHSIKS